MKKTQGRHRQIHSLPPDLSIENPDNWNFDGVPAVERATCCWWEYLRESGSVRDALQVLNGGKPKHTDKKNIAALFSSGLFDTYRMDSYPAPWQLLSPQDRKDLTRIRQPDSPPAPFTVSDNPDVLRQMADKAQTIYNERVANWDVYMKAPPTESHAMAMTLARSLLTPVSILEDSGIEYVLVRVNWRRSIDDIIAESSKWIRTSRPKWISPQRGRPPKSISPDAALDGLAIMRLLRHYKPSELEANKENFVVWELCRGRQFHARLEAKKRFQALLGLQELPLSWGPTKGGRSR